MISNVDKNRKAFRKGEKAMLNRGPTLSSTYCSSVDPRHGNVFADQEGNHNKGNAVRDPCNWKGRGHHSDYPSLSSSSTAGFALAATQALACPFAFSCPATSPIRASIASHFLKTNLRRRNQLENTRHPDELTLLSC